MPVLQQRDQQALRRKLTAELKRDVNLTLFTQADSPLFIPGRECRSCGATQELLEEVSALSPKIHLNVVDFHNDAKTATDGGIERIPALTIDTGGRGKARFYGMPSGLEFAMLVDSLTTASSQRTNLELETRKKLRRLSEQVHIQVFVTPTCRHSPSIAYMALQMAMESPKVTADVIEVQEFPDLAHRHSIQAVPKTVINDRYQITGAVPEEIFLSNVLRSIGDDDTDQEETSTVSDQTTLITQISAPRARN